MGRLFAFYFFSLRAALVHLALIAAVYAVRSRPGPGGGPADGWVARSPRCPRRVYSVAGARPPPGPVADLTGAALRDPLTGLLNRRGFENDFDVELERARRTDQPLSLIVGDLDRF